MLLIFSAYFLFTYADKIDKTFHQKTIEELLRVAKKETRIFPLVDLAGNRYKYLDEPIFNLKKESCPAEQVLVPYEFQKNGNTMGRLGKITGQMVIIKQLKKKKKTNKSAGMI